MRPNELRPWSIPSLTRFLASYQIFPRHQPFCVDDRQCVNSAESRAEVVLNSRSVLLPRSHQIPQSSNSHTPTDATMSQGQQEGRVVCRRVLFLAATLLAVAASAALGASQPASYQVKWLPVRDCGPGGAEVGRRCLTGYAPSGKTWVPIRSICQQLITPSPSCSTAEEPQRSICNVLHNLGLRTARLSS